MENTGKKQRHIKKQHQNLKYYLPHVFHILLQDKSLILLSFLCFRVEYVKSMCSPSEDFSAQEDYFSPSVILL